MIATAPTASALRPLPLRRRPDLDFAEQTFRGERRWAVRDRVGGRYYLLRDEEYELLAMLDGETSVAALRRRFERRFAPRRLGDGELERFLERLHADGLVVSIASGQGDALADRARMESRKRSWQAWSNPLAIRLGGVDPGRFVDALYGVAKWVFSRAALGAIALTVLVSVGLLLMRADDVARRLPEFRRFFAASNLLPMMAALGFVKLLHELGHAIVCRHFGARCREMGVLLFVFTPTLYCDVSDAWMLPGKWRRMAVGAAGVGVELVVAAVAAILWFHSVPGPFNAFCLDVVFVCSVGTLIFNANPLLRYDGYYVLFDWLEVPNAGSRSRSLVASTFGSWFLGTESGFDDPKDRRLRYFLLAYASAASAYRIVVVVGILWFVENLLEPYRLEIAARLLALFVVAMWIVPGVVGIVQFARDDGRRAAVKWRAAWIRGGVVAALLAGFLFTPLPMRVVAPIVMEPAEAETIYVTTPGVLVSAIEVNATVSEADELGRLENVELEATVAEARTDWNEARLQLDALEARRVDDPAARTEIPTSREAVRAARDRLDAKLREQRDLVLRAPRDGIVLPARASNDPENAIDPLRERYRGLRLPMGAAFCRVGDRNRLDAMLVVAESDVEFVRPGQTVSLRLPALPHATPSGTVAEIGEIDLDVVPPELAGAIPTTVDADGRAIPVETLYRVRITFDESYAIPIGATGRAAVNVAPRSVASRLSRFARRTFRFDW